MPLDSIDNPFIPNDFNLPERNITGINSPIGGLPGQYMEIIPGAVGPRSGAAINGVPKGEIEDQLSKITIVAEPAGQVFPPINSLPFSIYRRVLVCLQPAPDGEQTNSQTNVEIANRVPLSLPLVDTLTNNNWTTVSNGSGEAAGLDVPPGHAAVIDRFGVTTFSQLAEFDLLWSIGVGIAGSVTIGSIKTILPQVRGWEHGTASAPAQITGQRLIMPTQDPLRLSVFVTHSQVTAGVPGIWKPTAHYVEVSITGWLIPNFKQRPGSEGYREGVLS